MKGTNSAFFVVSLSIFLSIAFLAKQTESQESRSIDSRDRHYFLLLDTSTSMNNPRFTRENRIYRLKKAVIRKFIPYLGENTILHLITFDKGIQSQQSFDFANAKEAKRAVEFVQGIDAKGAATYAWSSLRYVLGLALEKFSGHNDVQVFMYTDGKDNERNGPTVDEVVADYEVLHEKSKETAGLQVFTLGFSFADETASVFNKAGVPVKSVSDQSEIPVPTILEFRWQPEDPVGGNAVYFNNESIPKGIRKESVWNFGDKTRKAKVVHPEHVFDRPGEYDVTLAAGGHHLTHEVMVGEELSVDFDWSPEKIQAGEEVKFKADCDGTVQGYEWEIENGIVQGNRNKPEITVKFPKSGKYVAKLKARGYQTTNETDKIVKVDALPKPTVTIKIHTKPPYFVGENVLLTTDVHGKIDSYRWMVDGDIISEKKDAEPRNFDSPGERRIVVIVKGPGGTVKAEKNIIINPKPVVAKFSIEKQKPGETIHAGRQVTFRDQSEGPVSRRKWTINGNRLTNKNPQVTFDRSGTIDVILQVVGKFGVTDQTKRNIDIAKALPPTAAFSIQTSPTERRVGRDIFFMDKTKGIVSEWLWNFGDGETSTNQHASHTYATTGLYEVVLSAIGMGGNTKEKRKIEMKPAFSVGFTADIKKGILSLFYRDPKMGFLGLGDDSCEVRIQNQSTGDNLTYKWCFGDGSTSTDEHPRVHRYEKTGTYQINLDATYQDTGMQLSASSITLQIKPGPWPAFFKRSGIATGVLAFLCFGWWYIRRPPPIRSSYMLDSLLPKGEDEIWVGGGWRGNSENFSGRFHIPLPAKGAFVGPYLKLSKSPEAEDLSVSSREGVLCINDDAERLSKCSDHLKPEGKVNELKIRAGSVFFRDGDPYIGIIDDNGLNAVKPGWMVYRTGISENLVSIRGRTKLSSLEWPDNCVPFLPDEIFLCENIYKLRAEIDNHGVAHFLCETLDDNNTEGDIEL